MNRSITRVALALALTSVSTSALAVDWSANIGFESQYFYRGIFQSKSSAQGGIDMEAGGFYLGAWGADVDDGVEIDGYGGYNFEIGDFTLGAGATIYTYTGDFDDTYTDYPQAPACTIALLLSQRRPTFDSFLVVPK